MDDLFTRDEVLGGLPAKRANTSLFLIEQRTAQLISIAHQFSQDIDLNDDADQVKDAAFIEAFTLGRDSPARPTVQELERYALRWADLVPHDNPRVQAAIAHLISQRYRFRVQDVPQLRATLELDDPVVQAAYLRLYQAPLTEIYAEQLSWAERYRWVYARLAQGLEKLPPFWLALIFTVTANFSQGALALPIAVSSIGPLPGLALLGIIGAINLFTIACMAEAAARSGSIRYGSAFLGRLVTDYLGKEASGLLSLAVVTLGLLGFTAATMGLSVTLARFTQISANLWAGIILAIVLIRLWREGRKFGVTTLMVLGALSLFLMVILGSLALTHLNPAYLAYQRLPWQAGVTFEPSQIAGLIGGVLVSFQGSSRVPHCAKLILPRDGSGRSLLWGSILGTLVTIALLGFWLIAVSGAVSATELAAQRGTALDPLVDVVGPAVTLIGAVMVCLLLGLAALRTSDLLFNLVRERLPNPSPFAQVLRLVQAGQTDIALIAQQIGEEPSTVRRLLSQLEETGLVKLPSPQPKSRGRGGRSRGAVPGLDALVGDRAAPASPPEPDLPEPSVPLPAPKSAKSAIARLVAHPVGRFCICATPTVVMVGVTELLLLTQFSSFSKILSVIGIVSVSLISGIFPILLLLASRNKGEIPFYSRLVFLNNPVFTGGIYLLFLGILLGHGLVIWQNPIERLLALAVAIGVLVVTVMMYRQGAFWPRLVIELRDDLRLGEPSVLNFTAQGHRIKLDVQVEHGKDMQTERVNQMVVQTNQLQQVVIQGIPAGLRELKLWVHQVRPDGQSAGTQAQAHIASDRQVRAIALNPANGQAVLPLPGTVDWVRIDWVPPTD